MYVRARLNGSTSSIKCNSWIWLKYGIPCQHVRPWQTKSRALTRLRVRFPDSPRGQRLYLPYSPAALEPDLPSCRGASTVTTRTRGDSSSSSSACLRLCRLAQSPSITGSLRSFCLVFTPPCLRWRSRSHFIAVLPRVAGNTVCFSALLLFSLLLFGPLYPLATPTPAPHVALG